MQYSDFDNTFKIITAASNLAFETVLYQAPFGKDLASPALEDHETNYCNAKYLRSYMFEQKFKILQSTNLSSSLMSFKALNSKLIQRRLQLEEFIFEIFHEKDN